MSFLLFFISILFSSIFYFFYVLSKKEIVFSALDFPVNQFVSLSWNLLIESWFFFIIWIIFLIIFTSFLNKKKDVLYNPYVFNFFKNNFNKILYYVGFILFYSSLYIILKDLSFKFSYIIFIINILILSSFYITKKFFILSDLLKINTIIFSSIYIFLYLNIFITKFNSFIFIDFLNSLLIFTSFFITLYSDKFLLKKKSDSWFLIHLFVYIFFFLIFYFSKIFENIYLLISIFGFILNFYIFHFLKKIEFFKNSLTTLKIIGIFISYLSIISGIIYLYNYSFNYFIVSILLYLSFFNFKIHKSYENYISFSFFLAGFYFLIFYFYFNFEYRINHNNVHLSIFTFLVAILTVFSTYIYHYEWIFDYYLMLFLAFVINIFSTIFFFYTNSFDLLNLWIILLFDSITIFLSYYKIKQIDD